MPVSRRDFLRGTSLAAPGPADGPRGRVLSAHQWRTLALVQDHRLPSEPGAAGSRDVQATPYLDAVLPYAALGQEACAYTNFCGSYGCSTGANGMARAESRKRDEDGNLVWGKPLKDRITDHFREGPHLRFEVFSHWTPVDDCRVSLDPSERDKRGLPVARVRLGYHPRDLAIGRCLAAKASGVLERMGLRPVHLDHLCDRLPRR